MKSILDVGAAMETHTLRAANVLSRHVKNVNKAITIIGATQQVVKVEGIELDISELREEVLDIAEIIDSLRQDAMDMLGAHIQTIKEIEDKLTGKR